MKKKLIVILSLVLLLALATQPALARQLMATFTGTDGNDAYEGTSKSDIIRGFGGNDDLSGEGGNDTINGGNGSDVIDGGSGADVLRGGNGKDNIDGGGNNELQYYTDNAVNAWQEQGWLVIQALRQDYLGKAYTSARMTTARKGDWLYGRMDVRTKLPKGRGLWPAIWMMPTDSYYGGWPRSGEIDIMEKPWLDDRVNYALHWDGYGKDHKTAGANRSKMPELTEGFHDYGLLWTKEEYVFYVDGVPLWKTGAAISNRSEYVVLSCEAQNNSWAGWIPPGGYGTRDTTVTGLQVDWVRVWQKK